MKPRPLKRTLRAGLARFGRRITDRFVTSGEADATFSVFSSYSSVSENGRSPVSWNGAGGSAVTTPSMSARRL